MRRSAWRSVNELCDAEGTINRDLEFFFEVFKKVYHGKGEGRFLPIQSLWVRTLAKISPKLTTPLKKTNSWSRKGKSLKALRNRFPPQKIDGETVRQGAGT